MDEKKVAFIICTNNDLWYEECLWYIEQLQVPEGFTVDVIKIADAISMCEAYNAAMERSDAKYKVYLHHDVFIYYRGFIEDIIKTFQSDQKLGMMGMVGMINLPKNAVIWNAWDMGSVYTCDRERTHVFNWKQDRKKSHAYVTAIDGMLMATQYDIKWREDLELGWDFYDISQSLEFKRRGYYVGIPTQKEPWCMHDCGYSKLEHYDQAREIVLREYGDFFDEIYVPVYNENLQSIKEQVFQQMKNCIETGEIGLACQIRDMVKEGFGHKKVWNNNLQYAINILDIFEQEQQSDAEKIFLSLKTWEQMVNYYTKIVFLTRRMENDINTAEVKKLQEMIEGGKIAKEVVWDIAKHSVINQENVCRKIYGEEAKQIIAEMHRAIICSASNSISDALDRLENVPIQIQMRLFHEKRNLFVEYISLLEQEVEDLGICKEDIINNSEQLDSFKNTVQILKGIAKKYS